MGWWDDGEMPGRFERHRRTKWEWGLPGSRSGEVRQAVSADPDPARKAPAKKDTRRWCKGKPGAEHAPHLVLDTSSPHFRADGCRWSDLWSCDLRKNVIGWTCFHREVCANCDKILRDRPLPRADCPAYPGTPEQRAGAERQLAESEARRAEWAQQRKWPVKPPITGPQGYRKRRAGI